MMLNLHIYDSFGHLISLLVISLFSYCRINMYCRLLLQFSSLILPLLFKEMDGARICQVGTLCAKLVKKRFSSLCDVHWAEIHPIMSLSLVVIAEEGPMFALSCSETLMGCWILCIYYQEYLNERYKIVEKFSTTGKCAKFTCKSSLWKIMNVVCNLIVFIVDSCISLYHRLNTALSLKLWDLKLMEANVMSSSKRLASAAAWICMYAEKSHNLQIKPDFFRLRENSNSQHIERLIHSLMSSGSSSIQNVLGLWIVKGCANSRPQLANVYIKDCTPQKTLCFCALEGKWISEN